MSSTVPYLVRGINEWILDNGCTPYLIVDALKDGVIVPVEHVKDGQIVLNISPSAIRDLIIDDDGVSFNGRFHGVVHQIYAPVTAILGIITREDGEGMWFPKEESPPAPDSPEDDDPPPGPQKKDSPPTLRVIK